MGFLKRIFSKISKWYKGLGDDVKPLIPIAIKIVDAIKKVMDSPIDDIVLSIIKAAIPGTVDDVFIDKVQKVLEEWIPKILIILSAINEVDENLSQDEQLKIVLTHFSNGNEEFKAAFYHNFATLILEKLADGKLTKSECIILTEYYYKNNFENET